MQFLLNSEAYVCMAHLERVIQDHNLGMWKKVNSSTRFLYAGFFLALSFFERSTALI